VGGAGGRVGRGVDAHRSTCNSERATPSSGLTANVSRYTSYATSHHLGEVQSSTYYERKALDWAVRHPARETVLYAGKVVYDFAPTNRLHTDAEASPTQSGCPLRHVNVLPAILETGGERFLERKAGQEVLVDVPPRMECGTQICAGHLFVANDELAVVIP
jgi:hypothetical protein